MLTLSDLESRLKFRYGTDNIRIKSQRLNMALLRELSSLDRLNAEKLLHENGPFFMLPETCDFVLPYAASPGNSFFVALLLAHLIVGH
jgi:hypothetical protein